MTPRVSDERLARSVAGMQSHPPCPWSPNSAAACRANFHRSVVLDLADARARLKALEAVAEAAKAFIDAHRGTHEVVPVQRALLGLRAAVDAALKDEP